MFLQFVHDLGVHLRPSVEHGDKEAFDRQVRVDSALDQPDCLQQLAETFESEEFGLYRTIERIFPDIFREEKGADKKICTNVDFYSGFVYSMLGIPPELYTPLFAISRIAGWCAHRLEEIRSGRRIYRPAFKQIGEMRPFVRLADRR